MPTILVQRHIKGYNAVIITIISDKTEIIRDVTIRVAELLLSNFLSGSNWSKIDGNAKMRTVHFHKLWTSHFQFKRPFSFRPSGRPFLNPFIITKRPLSLRYTNRYYQKSVQNKINLFQQKSRKSDRNWKSCLLSWIYGCTSDLHSDDNIHIFKCNCDRNWSNCC